MTEVYRLSLRGLTTQDLRALSPNWVSFALLWMVRTLRFELTTLAGIPLFDHLDEVAYESIPEASRNALRAMETACQAAGLMRRCCYRSPIIAPGPGDFGLIFSASDGRITVNLHAQWQRHTSPMTVVGTIVASSRLGNGGWLISSNTAWWSLDPPPNTERRHDPNWSPEELLAQHQRWLSERNVEATPIDRAQLLDEQATREREFLQMMIDRGILVPMTEQELNRLLRQMNAEASQSLHNDSSALTRLKQVESASALTMIILVLLSGFMTTIPAAMMQRGAALFMFVWLGLTIARRMMTRSARSRAPTNSHARTR